MRSQSLGRAHTGLTIAQRVAGGLAAIVGALLKANLIDVEIYAGPTAKAVVQFAQTTAWISIPVSVLVVPVLGVIKQRVGDPRIWGIVHRSLDDFRSRLFGTVDSAPKHEHRVTLFKWESWCLRLQCWPPWRGWLIPVERSGHTTQVTDIVFLAPDDADKAQGVAGQAWSRRALLVVDHLPDLKLPENPALENEYADFTWMTLAAVQKRRPRARSLCGIPVEVGGTLWGVIVIDSRSEELPEAEIRTYYNDYARFLGYILEGI